MRIAVTILFELAEIALIQLIECDLLLHNRLLDAHGIDHLLHEPGIKTGLVGDFVLR